MVATEVEDTATAAQAGTLLDGVRDALLDLLAEADRVEFEPTTTIARIGDPRVTRIEEARSALVALVPDAGLVTIREDRETHLGAVLLQLDVVIGAVRAATALYATRAAYDETARQAWETLGDMGVDSL